MFWTKKTKILEEDEAYKGVLKLMQLLEAKLAKVEMEIELMKLKAKKKIFKESEIPDPAPETTKYNDGFDELRKLNKDNG